MSWTARGRTKDVDVDGWRGSRKAKDVKRDTQDEGRARKVQV